VRPTVAVVGDQVRVTFRDGVVAEVDDLMGVLCWCAGDMVQAALERDLAALPVPINPLTRAERLQRIAQLERELLEHELIEESWIVKAHGDGLEVLRRTDIVNVGIVLGVVIAKPQEVAA
jgi:hypothetical protein